MTLKEVNYYGLKHEEVAKKFTGGLTYVRSFQIRGNTWAVYKAANPDRELGRKDYMMLGKQPLTDKWYVSGCTPEDMEKERYQDAVMCANCQTVLYSINRHHYHTCDCENKTMVDGGKDYLRCGGVQMDLVLQVRLDLVTGLLVDLEEMAELNTRQAAARAKLRAEESQYSEKPKAKKKPAAKRAKRSQRSKK